MRIGLLSNRVGSSVPDSGRSGYGLMAPFVGDAGSKWGRTPMAVPL